MSNWLAHILLAGPDDEYRLGGVLADLVSTVAAHGLSPGIRRGIALHHSLDAFGDAHPAACASNRRLVSAGVGLRPAAAGIAVDMLYDHLLARDWPRYCPTVSLAEFAEAFYRSAARGDPAVPPKARLALEHMRTENWLESYRDLGEVRTVLERIRRRLSPRAAAASPLPAAAGVFERNPTPFEEDFARFWPDMVTHAAKFLSLEKTLVSERSGGAISRPLR